MLTELLEVVNVNRFLFHLKAEIEDKLHHRARWNQLQNAFRRKTHSTLDHDRAFVLSLLLILSWGMHDYSRTITPATVVLEARTMQCSHCSRVWEFYGRGTGLLDPFRKCSLISLLQDELVYTTGFKYNVWFLRCYRLVFGHWFDQLADRFSSKLLGFGILLLPWWKGLPFLSGGHDFFRTLQSIVRFLLQNGGVW